MSEGARIQFDNGIYPVISNSGGVYNLRQRTGTGTGSIRASSLSRHGTDVEAENNNIEDCDIKKKQVRPINNLFW
jgi:hypothetical protein